MPVGFQNASGIFPPDSAVVRPPVNIKGIVYSMEDGGHPAWDVCCTGNGKRNMWTSRD